MEISNDPFKGKKKGRMIVSCSISPEFHQVAFEHHIGWSEALRVGISMILAERGISPYDNRLNLFRKMKKFQSLAEEYMEKHNELKSKLDKTGENKLSKQADEILNQGVPQEIKEGEE